MGASGNPAKAAAAKAAKNKPLTFDHLKSRRKPVTRTLAMCLDSEVLQEFQEASAEHERVIRDHRSQKVAALRFTPEQQEALRRELQPERDAAEARLEAAKKALEEATVYLKLRSIGRRAFEELWNEHPPTDEQVAEYQKEHGENERPPYNPDTFAPALMAAVITEPDLTLEEATEIYEEWNSQDVTAIFTACMDVCNRSQIDSLGKGFGRTVG